ncbi:MFS transporter [Nocardiopsis sp. CT-R113]|uniref:MFS transporter n=1 Tax=Nocardiopsis codii TaxID=3065942 RepID=A0ABU7K5A7_9ACTN|nr:MFS transporter [Nocardiopsis sp. CT-R113]MEE2037438.1 MFS transporter [Nocardiopsis sp. CT-R113]
MKPDTAHSNPERGTSEKRALYARSALAGYFFLTGAVLPVWASRIPAVKEQSGVGADELGLALLCMGVGAIITARVGGALLDRCAPRFVIAPAAVAASLCLALPGAATGPRELAVALFVLGSAHSLLNISVNTHAAFLQQPLGRPLLSSFHAFVSLGASFGALCGVVTAHADLGPLATFQAMGALLAVAALIPARALVRYTPPTADSTHGGGRVPRRPLLSPILLALGAMTMAAMLSESAVQDWSALYAQESVDASAAMAAAVFASFTVMMTVGRIMGDRLALLLGRVNLLRSGALTAVCGFALALGLPTPATVLAGFALIGLGLSCAVPQLFSAAAEIDPRHVGRNLGTVAAIGYVGPLVGAPAIGLLSAQGGVGTGLLVPVLLTGALALSAGSARRRTGAGAADTAGRGGRTGSA